MMKHLLVIFMVMCTCFCMAQNEPQETRHKKKVKSIRLPIPDGMKYVPSGSFKMQGKDNGGPGGNADTRLVQMTGFYMDATEVTNEQYREFTNWVRDSIANTLLGDEILVPDGSKRAERKKINWNDAKVQQKLSNFYIREQQWGERRVDVTKLVYRYDFFDNNAFKKNSKEKPVTYLYALEVPVYPDTSVWKTPYTYNDPVARQYFSFQGFNKYPVVGINLMQSIAYCNWRTRMWREEHNDDENLTEISFRLPTEEEWEWASRAGSDAIPKLFQPVLAKEVPGMIIKEPKADNAANDYGLKNMAGNVSEWTISGAPDFYDSETSATALLKYHDGTRPTGNENKRIVRGGSWRNELKDQQPGVRFMYPLDSGAAYIGFRCVFTEVLAQRK